MIKKLLVTMAFSVFCYVSPLFPQSQPQTPAVEDFELDGTALFQCECTAYACPCQKNGAPTHGTCEAADSAHISHGHYGKVQLDGLNVVVVGNLVDREASRLYGTIYIDEKATSAQRAAIVAIVKVESGGNETSPLGNFQVKVVPMAFRESAGKTTYTLKIPGILEEKAVLHRDASGKPVSTVTAMDAWSNTEHYLDNVTYTYHDPEVHREWDHSGGYANIKYFHLTKTMYDKKEMLLQYGDFSGHWTPEQLAIIRKQQLKK
jgi:hypothetical protein